MIEVSVVIPPDLLKQLDPANVEKALRLATFEVGKAVRVILVKPAPPSNSPVIWASAKQRAYYFAMRRAQGLPPKYDRTNKLQDNWQVEHSGATDAVVANRDLAYAQYVQRWSYQSRQHAATGWPTDALAAETVKRSGDVERITDAAVRKEFGL